MCEPMTIIAGVAAAAGLMQQMAQADEDSSYQNKLSVRKDQENAVNTGIAQKSAALQQKQINNQTVERDVAASQKLQANSIAKAEAHAKAVVSRGESGVSGVSIDSLLNDFSRVDAVFSDSVIQNIEGHRQNAEAQKDAVGAQLQGRMASFTPYIPTPVASPDYAGAVGGFAKTTASDKKFLSLFESSPDNYPDNAY
jgi:hypothetical protein